MKKLLLLIIPATSIISAFAMQQAPDQLEIIRRNKRPISRTEHYYPEVIAQVDEHIAALPEEQRLRVNREQLIGERVHALHGREKQRDLRPAFRKEPMNQRFGPQ
jgi:hypothetical protein